MIFILTVVSYLQAELCYHKQKYLKNAKIAKSIFICFITYNFRVYHKEVGFFHKYKYAPPS